MIFKRKIKIIIAIFLLIPILFIGYFIYGFIFHENAMNLNSISFKEYKSYIKKQYPNIEELDTYYQFGRITFDYKVKEINEEEFTEIIKETKKFVIGINDNEFSYDQATIRATFKFDNDYYEFESPYWIQHSDGDLALPSTKNNYEIWYRSINGKGEKN